MAFTKQTTQANRAVVQVDFPDLPKFPKMTITKDHNAMQEHESAMKDWYDSLRTSMLKKLEDMATEIQNLKSK